MSLRVKVECILFLVLMSVVLGGYGIQHFLVLPSLDPLEEQVAERDMERAVALIQEQDDRIDGLCAKWVEAPALLKLFQPLSPSMDGGWMPQTLTAADLSFVCLSDANGQVLYCDVADVDGGLGAAEGQKGLEMSSWDPSHVLLSPAESLDAAINGVFLVGTIPFLVSSRPVISSDESGPRLGRLVLGCRLTKELLLKEKKAATLGFNFWAVNDPFISPQERSVLQGIVAGKLRPVTQVTDDFFRVYAAYPDIQGTPALLMRSVVHRSVLAKAYDALQKGLLAQVGIGLLGLVGLIVVFRITVLNPLIRLTQHTVYIRDSKDLSKRLGMRRTDEIGTLASEYDRMVAQVKDEMEKQRLTEGALRESEERYALAVRGANDGLWDWDFRSERIHFSDRWKSMLGYQDDEIGDTPEEWFGRIHPDDRERVESAYQAHAAGHTAHFESEYQIRHKGDNYMWVLCRGLAVRDDAGQATRMAGSHSDITLRKIFEEQLRHQALHDSLTALPNRALLFDRLNQAIKRGQRESEYRFAVMFLDLDRFKVINDSLGHTIGDRLLSLIAEKLIACLRHLDTVTHEESSAVHSGGGGETIARFGGDEFIIMLDNINNVLDVTAVAERIQAIFKEPFLIDENKIFSTASMGIVVNDASLKTPEDFIRNADTAMYRAKANGKARFEVFDTDMHSKAMERLHLENDLRHAIEAAQFEVYYQPIVSLADGKIRAFEALVRWNHPERGLVSPADFIPIAEETGLILHIGDWVLRTACRQTRVWQVKLPQARDVVISVNLSAKEFTKAHLVEDVENVLVETGLAPQHLKLEITESAIMDSMETVTRTLGQLRDLEIQLSIDDFGTGYSSLSYLHRFPTNCLKIDQAFIRDMIANPESVQIVKTIVLLAHALDMTIIAEGIETEEQRDMLREFGCEFGQGYFFSPPVTTELTTELLESGASWPSPDEK
jgi:PAS domain S-box-containing protein